MKRQTTIQKICPHREFPKDKRRNLKSTRQINRSQTCRTLAQRMKKIMRIMKKIKKLK
jgi:hypothetical protein